MEIRNQVMRGRVRGRWLCPALHPVEEWQTSETNILLSVVNGPLVLPDQRHGKVAVERCIFLCLVERVYLFKVCDHTLNLVTIVTQDGSRAGI